MRCTPRHRRKSLAIRSRRRKGSQRAESIIDKYIAAVGGAQKVAAFTSFTGTGTYRGYDDSEDTPMEIAANAMGQIATVAHPASGVITIASDGRAGWHGLSADRQAVPADCA